MFNDFSSKKIDEVYKSVLLHVYWCFLKKYNVTRWHTEYLQKYRDYFWSWPIPVSIDLDTGTLVISYTGAQPLKHGK